MLAARNGNLEAIKVLLDHKANVNGKEELRGTTPIMWASSEGHADAVKLLIAAGADINATSKPDTGGKPRNNLANPVTQRLNSGFGVNGQKAEPKAAGKARPWCRSEPMALRISRMPAPRRRAEAGTDPECSGAAADGHDPRRAQVRRTAERRSKWRAGGNGAAAAVALGLSAADPAQPMAAD